MFFAKWLHVLIDVLKEKRVDVLAFGLMFQNNNGQKNIEPLLLLCFSILVSGSATNFINKHKHHS